MAYSVRGRVLVCATLLALGSATAGACSSSSGGTIGAGGAGGDASGSPCDKNIDCPGDLLCRVALHRCVECLQTSDCADGEVCANASCRPGKPGETGDAGSPSTGGTHATGQAGTGGSTLPEAGSLNQGGNAGSFNQGGNAGSLNQGGNAGSLSQGGNAGSSGEGNASAGGAGGVGGDCESVPIDPCVGIPHFTGTQTVDGDASDFCDIAPFVLSMATSPYYRAPKAPLTSTTQATFRVGWSALALHVFIDVEDHTVHPNLSGSILNVWNGDNVEIYASPLAPAGLFNASRSSESGAFQVIAVPPNPAGIATTPSGLAAFTSTGQASALSAAQYKLSLTSSGYSFEAQIPWTTAAPTPGASMGFDAGLSDDIDGLTNVNSQFRDYYALLYNKGILGNCTTDHEPYCDSRNWCVPEALP